MEGKLVKKQKKYVLGILMCMILCFLAPGINGQAATPENVMQSSKAVSGKLETTSKGVRYYNSRTGKYEKKKWLKVKNNIYYFTSKGYAKTGWKTHNGRKYYFDQKGRLVTSWQKIGKYTYYMWKNKGNLSGSAATGKVQIAKRYYYFSKKGVMETGWKKIAGYYYYFSPQTGQMAVNTTVGKYKVDSRGRRVSSTSGKKNTGKVDYWVGDSRTVGLGSALGVPPVVCASFGYAAVFGSATNTVIAPILIGLEVFGSQNAIPLVVVCLLAYLVNGNHSIYGAQAKALCSFEEK